MRAWLLVLAVLATFYRVTQVASTQEVSLSFSTNPTTNNIDSYSILLENNNNNDVNSDSFFVDSFSSKASSDTKNNFEEISRSQSSNSIGSSSKSRTSESENNDENQQDLDLSSENKIVETQTEIKQKPNAEQLVEIEKNLLTLFGFKKRPKIDRSKVVIPEAMKKLYEQIMGHELDSINIPKAGLLTKNANTVRSFTHEGKFVLDLEYF